MWKSSHRHVTISLGNVIVRDSAPDQVRPDGHSDAATADPRVPLDDRIVLRHTGDEPTRKTISLPDGACRALTLTANSIADNLVQS
jgi:hypothetical protein